MIGLLFVSGVMPATAVAGAGGTVTAWGNNQFGQTSVPAGLDGVVAISAGYNHNLALHDNGTVTAWGDNSFGKATVPAGLANVVAVSAGWYHSLALHDNGTVTAWGDNSYGQAPAPNSAANVVAIAAGAFHSLLLHADGAVTSWGAASVSLPSELTDVIAIAANQRSSLALRSNGTVTAKSDGFYGLGWTPPVGLTNVVAIAAGGAHNLALLGDGTVTGWHQQYSGPLASTAPSGLSDVVAIAAGFEHSLALRSDGTVVAWGYNPHGQTTVPAGLANVTAIAAGHAHSLALVGPVYEFIGFDSPVDNPPAVNLAIAGRTIPLKWRLLDGDGQPVTDLDSVQVTTTLAPTDPDVTVEPIEEYTSGKSGLQNLGDGYYQYNWTTPKSYTKSTRTLTLDLGTYGGPHELLFMFR
jgi:hypothetical protein